MKPSFAFGLPYICLFLLCFLSGAFPSIRYRSGIRGHMKAVVMDLLRQYLKVEIQFQHGERCSGLNVKFAVKNALAQLVHTGELLQHQ